MRRTTVIISLLILIIGGLFYFWSARNGGVFGPKMQAPNQENAAGHVQKAGETPSPNANPSAITTPGDTTLNSPPAPPPEDSWTESTRTKIKILREILSSKNDNDPRLDRDLSLLNTEDKRALRSQYQAFPPEARNERGTVVFLVGRNLDSEADLSFFEGVLREAPCLSFTSCAERMKDEPDPHLEGPLSVSLNYPQMVAMNRLELWINKTDFSKVDRAIIASAFKTLQAATLSQIAQVSQKAKELLELLKTKAAP